MRVDRRSLFVGLCGVTVLTAGCSSATWSGEEEGQNEGLEELSLSEEALTTSSPKAMLAAGGYHTCGVTTANVVRCWGRNDYGQIGVGFAGAPVLSPTLVTGLTSVVAITAGDLHTCALKSDGTVWCWGSNEHWQLGIGPNPVNPWEPTPQQVIGANNIPLKNVVAVTAGGNHTCAVTNQGQVRCWGSNDVGQLGVNPNIVTLGVADPPVQPPSTGSYKSVGVGSAHTCARTSHSEVYCWGDNVHGQLGQDPSVTAWSASPLLVSEVSAAVVDAGGYHTCAVPSGDKPKCWGLNDHGQLADCSLIPKWKPTEPYYHLSATAVSLGDFHTCYVITNTAGAKCSGYNSSAQVGNYSLSDAWANDDVKTGTDTYLAQAQDVAAGAEHTCAMLTGHKILCWGNNSYGQGGVGTSDPILPVATPSLF